MKIGIDKIGFYAPNLFIDLRDLARKRNIEPDKFTYGLGQLQMGVCPLTQDSVSMAANAADQILTSNDINDIDLVIFATESGVDFSKSGAAFVHGLLKLNHHARSIEMKHACYSATMALEVARGHINLYPNKKVLILASDIAIYGLDNSAEPTQGAGAVAILVSKDPKLVQINHEHVFLTDDVMDFWKPNYSKVALVDGHFSSEKYQNSFLELFNKYIHDYEMTVNDFDAICMHTPYSKIGQKSLRLIADEAKHEKLFTNYQHAVSLNKRVGNIYTGSLYLNLLSLLERGNLKPGDLIGMFSYGSGAVAEFFTVCPVEGYQDHLLKKRNEAMLDNRILLTVEEYEQNFSKEVFNDIPLSQEECQDNAKYYFAGINNHQRIYKKR